MKVYFYDKGEFRPLYDFSLEEGDLFTVYNYDYHLCSNNMVDSSIVVIDSHSANENGFGLTTYNLNQNYFVSYTGIVDFLGKGNGGLFPRYFYNVNPNCPFDIFESNDFLPLGGGIACYYDNTGVERNPWQKNECSDIFIVLLSDGNPEISDIVSTISVIPNPASGQIRISELNYPITSFSLLDASGRYMSIKKISNYVYDVSNLSPGLYIIKLYSGQQHYSSKLIINE